MNDSSTNEVPASSACNQRNAYLLFYERTNRLGDAVGKFKVPGSLPNGVAQTVNGTPSFTGKRKERDEEDNESISNHSFPQQRIKSNGQINGKVRTSAPSSPEGKAKHSPQSRSTLSHSVSMRTPPASPQQKSQQHNSNSSSSFSQRPTSLLQQRKNSGSYGPLNPKAFFGQKDRHRNRPKMVTSMVGRPR